MLSIKDLQIRPMNLREPLFSYANIDIKKVKVTSKHFSSLCFSMFFHPRTDKMSHDGESTLFSWHSLWAALHASILKGNEEFREGQAASYSRPRKMPLTICKQCNKCQIRLPSRHPLKVLTRAHARHPALTAREGCATSTLSPSTA